MRACQQHARKWMCESRSERCAPTMHSKLWQQAYNAQKYGPDNYNRMIRTTGPGGDWKDLYRLLVTSLRASSVHFQQLSFDSLIVGLWGVSKAHGTAQITPLLGQVLAPADRAAVIDWVHWSDVLLRTFDGATTAAAVASSLGIQESAVLHFQPLSQPLLPAHAVIVDDTHKQLLLLVRGTSSWADCLTDIVAHTEQLGTGQAHSGMLDCARSVLEHCVPILKQQLQITPGYRIHCLGHSLGGGVAALAAYLLRNSPDWREQLKDASGVMATGFGTPPVLTQDLAEAVSSFTRTLVHDFDLVPRTCVASLAALRADLEAEKDTVYGSSSLLSSLKSSGVLEGGASLLGSVATAAIASKFIPGAGTAGKSRWMAAGLQVGASLLMNKAKQMHEEVMAAPAAAPAARLGAPAAAAATAAVATPAAGSGGAAAGAVVSSAMASSGSPGTATAGHVSGVAAAAGGGAAAGSTAGGFSFAEMRQAVCAAAATAAAAAGAAKGPALVPVGADSQASTAPHAAQQQQPHQKPTQQQQQQGESDGFRSSAPQTQQERYAEEEAGAKVQLYCPGQLWHLRRCTGDPGAEACSYELVRVDQPGHARFGGKIWVKRSMLSDHYLSEHMKGLLQLQAQLVEQAALLAC